MSTFKTKGSLAGLPLKPIDQATLEHIRTTFEKSTLPKIREDARLRARNVAVARTKIAFG